MELALREIRAVLRALHETLRTGRLQALGVELCAAGLQELRLLTREILFFVATRLFVGGHALLLRCAVHVAGGGCVGGGVLGGVPGATGRVESGTGGRRGFITVSDRVTCGCFPGPSPGRTESGRAG